MTFLVMMMFYSSVCAQQTIEFYTNPTIPYQGKSVHAYAIDFPDTLAGDTLFQVRAYNSYPVSCHRKIRTSVCFDNKCRLLDVIVHWNPTGRYLGFELPRGEFLSKSEHTPFTREEYVRLHSLLADPNSPLAGFSYNELVPVNAQPNVEIDAVSSPTAKHLLEFVVEGAAYTTYKLWHIVHGGSRDEVTRMTARVLSPELLCEILKSPNILDKIWGLDQRHRLEEVTPEIRRIILSFIASEEYSLAERAINAIQPVDLRDAGFQVSLLEKFDEANYSLKNRIIGKFLEAPEISPRATLVLAEKLLSVSGDLVSSILDVLDEKHIRDAGVLQKISPLLQHENVFISRQVFDFLTRFPVDDTDVQERIDQYKVVHGLR